jgi:hypothetical protein
LHEGTFTPTSRDGLFQYTPPRRHRERPRLTSDDRAVGIQAAQTFLVRKHRHHPHPLPRNTGGLASRLTHPRHCCSSQDGVVAGARFQCCRGPDLTSAWRRLGASGCRARTGHSRPSRSS